MRTKLFVIALLAGIMAISCTKEEVLTPTDQPTSEMANAYFTFDIVSGVNSTRSVDGNPSGDTHGNADNSGHLHVGTAGENTVSKIMLVFYNTNNETENGDGLAKTYDVGDNISVGIVKNSDGSYSPSESFMVYTTGVYKVLVIANPTNTLAAKNATNSADAKAIYNEIINGNHRGAVSDMMGANADYFMMANQNEVTINVTATNNKENPAKPAGSINIERVLAKATYRQVEEGNTYGIKATKYKYTISTVSGWVQNSSGSYTYYSSGFAAATTNEKNVNERSNIYVAVMDGETKYYTSTTDYTSYVDDVETTAKLMVENTSLASDPNFYPLYTATKNVVEVVETDYNLQLLEYALVNLNNSTYYIRHTGTQTAAPFGTLGPNTYLFDPNSPGKNTSGAFDGTNYFSNAWTTYKSAVSTLPFATLPGSDDDHGAVTNAQEATTVGGLLGYMFENGLQADYQTMDKTTSIVFKGKITDADGAGVTLFRYDDSFYKDLESLFEDVANMPGAGQWTTQQYIDGTIDTDDLKDLGIYVYKDGICYYAAQIKHFDDGNAENAGVNEFIKMRNNVYSIAVTNVDQIGFSEMEMIELENAIESGSESIYLTLEAKIVPWIVRFTDVEF